MKPSKMTHFFSLVSFVSHPNAGSETPSASWDLDPNLPRWEEHPGRKPGSGAGPAARPSSVLWIGGFPPV